MFSILLGFLLLLSENNSTSFCFTQTTPWNTNLSNGLQSIRILLPGDLPGAIRSVPTSQGRGQSPTEGIWSEAVGWRHPALISHLVFLLPPWVSPCNDNCMIVYNVNRAEGTLDMRFPVLQGDGSAPGKSLNSQQTLSQYSKNKWRKAHWDVTSPRTLSHPSSGGASPAILLHPLQEEVVHAPFCMPQIL